MTLSHETLRRRADLGAAIGLKMVGVLRFVQALAQWPGPAISIAAVSFLIYSPPYVVNSTFSKTTYLSQNHVIGQILAFFNGLEAP